MRSSSSNSSSADRRSPHSHPCSPRMTNQPSAPRSRSIRGRGSAVTALQGGRKRYICGIARTSLRLRFAPGPFSFENWCYGVSWSGPHRGFTLGENVFEPLAGNAPGMGRAEAIAPTARAAPNLHALLRDTEQLRNLTGGIVVELEFHYALSINFGERREPSCRRLPEMLGWGRFWRSNFSEAL